MNSPIILKFFPLGKIIYWYLEHVLETYLDGSFPVRKFVSHVDKASNTDCDKQCLNKGCIVDKDLNVSAAQHH